MGYRHGRGLDIGDDVGLGWLEVKSYDKKAHQNRAAKESRTISTTIGRAKHPEERDFFHRGLSCLYAQLSSEKVNG